MLEDSHSKHAYGHKDKQKCVTVKCIHCGKVDENMTCSKLRHKKGCMCISTGKFQRTGTLLKDGKKQCTVCGEFKNETEFHAHQKQIDKLYPACKTCACNRRRARKYKMTDEEFINFTTGDKNCEICNNPISNNRRLNSIESLCVDHCHKTGKIRGVLCSNCNSAIGFLKENPEIIKAALKYIEKHKETNDSH